MREIKKICMCNMPLVLECCGTPKSLDFISGLQWHSTFKVSCTLIKHSIELLISDQVYLKGLLITRSDLKQITGSRWRGDKLKAKQKKEFVWQDTLKKGPRLGEHGSRVR